MDARTKKIFLILAVAVPILLWRLSTLTKYLPASASAQTAAVAEEFAEVETTGGPSRTADGDLLSRLEEARRQIELQPWGRDPFSLPASASSPRQHHEEATPAPSDEPPPAAPKMRFTGVSKSNDRWMAIIQNQFVRVGDRIEGGFAVVEITKGSIVIEQRGWRFRYEIGSEDPEVSRVGSKK